MNIKTVNIIIAREYMNKVKKKSFLVTTFLVPLLFALVCLLPSIIMFAVKEKSQQIAVVDKSEIVFSKLESTSAVTYVDYSGENPDSLKTRLAEIGMDGVLVISELDLENKTVSASVYSPKPLGIDLTADIERNIRDAVEDYRTRSYDIEGLQEIMDSIKADISLTSYTMDAEGNESLSESGVYMLVSMVLGMGIYLFIAVFSGMVMSSVIEEKASRVVEVLMSSVKATELMFGKIIGVALVALTQFLLWILLTGVILGVAGTFLGPEFFAAADTTQMMQAAGADQIPGMDMEAMMSQAAPQGEFAAVFSTIANMPLGRLLVSFIVYFILGYLLYASLFAAIGSAVENEADSQQLQIPITIPLLLGFFIAFMVFKSPDSPIVFWGSMIPFTSPIVMLARIPFGVPVWELVLSIALLAATFVLCAWMSAKIYKIGILMFGKKSSFKDLIKWLKQ